MAKLPKRELLVRGLLACGWTKTDKIRTTKFSAYLSPHGGQVALVGPAGALRMLKAETDPVSQSVSLTGGTDYRAYVAVGDPNVTYLSDEEARAAFVLAVDTQRQRGRI